VHTTQTLHSQRHDIMTKSELIELFAERARIPKKRAEEVVQCILSAMGDTLAQGNRIEIRGFGSFSLNPHRAYVGRNPKTGNEVPVEAKQAVHFKVGRELRDLANQSGVKNPKSGDR
jgi:integration host factor subunit beta